MVYLSLLFSALAFAHTDTDWRLDHAALASARPVPISALKVSETYPELSIDPDFLRDKVAQLSGATPVEIDGRRERILERNSERGRSLARHFLRTEYEKLGFRVREITFGSGTNLLAEREGTENERTLVLSSHFDSVGNAGANDDALGTVGALAIAHALRGQTIRSRLRVLAFDREEAGLRGSQAYVRSLSNKEEILGAIQLEMLGTNRRADGSFHLIDCDRPDSASLTRSVMAAVASLALPLRRVAACTRRSDHASFWEAGIPALVISENFFGGDADPCYHRRCDVLDDRLNFEYAANILRATAAAAYKLLQ
jgi:hypothetical protein